MKAFAIDHFGLPNIFQEQDSEVVVVKDATAGVNAVWTTKAALQALGANN
ncbi:MAG: hypothetical protein AAGF83_24550 [Cyanobacteria bacterium P01_G01_bin.67]